MEQVKTHNNAGFFIRALAKCADHMLGFIVIAGLALPLIYVPLDQMQWLLAVAFSLFLLYFPLSGLYHMYFVSRYGGTIGKLLLGLKIRDEQSGDYLGRKMAFLRSTLGYLYSAKFFGIGYLAVLRNDENVAWHDELFGTRVEKSEGSILGYALFVLVLVLSGLILYQYLRVLSGTL